MRDYIELTAEERARRAERMAGGNVALAATLLAAGKRAETVWYFLDPEKGIRNGGRDPEAEHCASVWKDGNGKVWWTTDCVGFVVWSQGWARRVRAFLEYTLNGRGSINTDSMLLDMRNKQSVCLPVVMPFRGCVITMPSIRAAGGARKSPGHTGTVVGVDDDFDPKRPDLRKVKVAHASPRNHKKFDQAIGITDATVFGSRPGWAFLDFRRRPEDDPSP